MTAQTVVLISNEDVPRLYPPMHVGRILRVSRTGGTQSFGPQALMYSSDAM